MSTKWCCKRPPARSLPARWSTAPACRATAWLGSAARTQRPRSSPFRGEYYELKPEAQGLVNNLIYPVPDPAFPFLGVPLHADDPRRRRVRPQRRAGVCTRGLHEADRQPARPAGVAHLPGVPQDHGQALADGRGARCGGASARGRSCGRWPGCCRRSGPSTWVAAPAGVRAQAVGSDGSMVDDFLFVQSDRVVNVLNAPSPAATASLNIGGHIVERVAERFA